jgi:peptide/nickel transport system permease protein
MSAIEPLVQSTDLIAESAPAQQKFWRAVIRTGEAKVALSVTVLVLLVMLVGAYAEPYDPTKLATGPSLAGPSWQHFLGTDQLGRDIFSRFLSGGRGVLLIPMASTLIAYVVGGLVGLFSGYKRGFIDAAFGRLIDLLLTLPPLLLVLVLVSGLGTSNFVLVLVIAIVFAPRCARVVRASTLATVHQDYVVAAQARGERTLSILLNEITPNLAAPVLADMALRLTWGIIFVSTLSFLGLGEQPPSSNWGLMISESRNYLTTNPLATIVPSIGIGLLAISFNLFADAMTKTVARDEGGVYGL